MGDLSNCRCGCVPAGMVSLFAMAELREKHKIEQRKFDLIVNERVTILSPNEFLLDIHGLEINQLFTTSFIIISSNLKVLHLDHNNLESIPYGLFSILPNLCTLSLHDNLIKEIPNDVSKLNNLQSLRLDRNKLTILPDEIGQCKNLTELHLDGNITLSNLPASIGELQKLHHILMNDVGITKLPYSMYNCVSLQLITYNNEILDPPPNIMNDGIDSIRKYLFDKYSNANLGI